MGSLARAAVLGLVLVGGFSAPVVAHAEDDAATAQARKHFDAGLEAYKAGRYAEALASFTEANRVSPRESLQRNVAQTQRDLRDYAASYESYDKLLRVYGASMKAEDKSAAEKAREELDSLTGTIEVFIHVPGAAVVIDDKERGVAPLSARVNVGAHRVAVRAPGYEPFAQNLDVKSRERVTVIGPLAKADEDVPRPAPVPVAASRPVEPPPPAPSTTTEEEKRKGVYVRVELAGVFPTGQHNSVADGSVYGAAVPTEGSGLYGAGAGVRVGYSFGHFGIEGLMLGAYDHATVKADLGPRQDNWNFYRGGGVVGVAARAHPHIAELGPFRPTAGVGIGLAGRAVGYQRLIDGSTSKDKASFQFYMAPSMVFDIGFTVGHTPGVKFYMGFMAMLEFPGGVELPSGNSKDGQFPIPQAARVEAANGVEFFVGPTLGLAIGK